MMFHVRISNTAKQDLYAIYSYIAYELLVVETANKQLARIEKAILSLDVLPERNPIYDKNKWMNLRMMPIDNYCVFYVIDEEKNNVTIVRILYAKRNFISILK